MPACRRRAPRATRPVPARRGRHHRRHHRLRHGHRQAGRALRRPPGPAQERRGLLPGDRPRRPRRAARRRLDDLRPGGRGHAAAHHRGLARRRSASSASSMHKLDALLGLCESTDCRRQRPARTTSARRWPSPAATATPASTRSRPGTAPWPRKRRCPASTAPASASASAYLIDVLLGKDNERMRRFGHDQVSTFGIGKELSADQWKSVYRQLVAAGLAQVDVEGHGGLRLTEQSRPVLRGEQPVRLRQDPDRKRRRSSERSSPVVAPADPEANALWERLRARRRELAAEQNVPPYVVFGDVTLREMVTYRPRDAAELACLTGVGAVKLERYAEDFLRVLAEHQAEHGRPDKVPALPDKPLRTTTSESARGGRSSDDGAQRHRLRYAGAVPRRPQRRCHRQPARHQTDHRLDASVALHRRRRAWPWRRDPTRRRRTQGHSVRLRARCRRTRRWP